MDQFQSLGESIRKRIQASNAAGSIELFAHENHIPKSTLSEILNGKNDPRLSTLAKICSGLDIRLADLFADSAFENLVSEAPGKYLAHASPKAKRASPKPVPKASRDKGKNDPVRKR
jgi:transcriptional regulator with XRE-family HTH domain